MEEINLKFVIIGKEPTSANNMYWPLAKGRLTTKSSFRKYKKWIKKEVHKALEEEVRETLKESVNGELRGLCFDLKVSMPKKKYGYKSGKIKGVDASNYIKPTEDAIMESLDLNDKYDVEVHSKKFYNTEELWIVEVEITEKELWNRRELSDVKEESSIDQWRELVEINN